jgi:hypothetical protein
MKVHKAPYLTCTQQRAEYSLHLFTYAGLRLVCVASDISRKAYMFSQKHVQFCTYLSHLPFN